MSEIVPRETIAGLSIGDGQGINRHVGITVLKPGQQGVILLKDDAEKLHDWLTRWIDDQD